MFPPNFLSQKEYDAYLSCISNLKPGDKIEYTSNYGKIEGLFLYREFTHIRSYASNSNIPCYTILIGTERSNDPLRIFYCPTVSERQRFLSPAKKVCPKIKVGTTNIYWIAAGIRIDKIVKYNAVQEEKEKKEKAKAAKSLRASSKHA